LRGSSVRQHSADLCDTRIHLQVRQRQPADVCLQVKPVGDRLAQNVEWFLRNVCESIGAAGQGRDGPTLANAVAIPSTASICTIGNTCSRRDEGLSGDRPCEGQERRLWAPNTEQRDLTLESCGLLATAQGFTRVYEGDQHQLAAGCPFTTRSTPGAAAL
jgi:hypothetical protein